MRLYIHIPFCESKCFYCAFTSLTDKSKVKSYFDALLIDIKHHFSTLNLDKKSIKSVFIGGGTPSSVDFALFEPIFAFINPFLAQNAEITSEANPNSASFEWLKKMHEFGLNRISFGAQSFSEKKLKFLGRIHSVKEIFKSLENALNSGFTNINLDMIYDTKMDDKKMLIFELENLAKCAKMGLTHLSAYHLTLEKNTKFQGKFHYKKDAPNLMRFFTQSIENLGFPQYEVSNFGQICKHNFAYWQGLEYLGCGLGAVGFLSTKDGSQKADYGNLAENLNENLSKKARFYTHKSLAKYIKEPKFRICEHLSQKDLNLEHLFLGLRSCVGIAKSSLTKAQISKAEFLVKHKKLVLKNKAEISREIQANHEIQANFKDKISNESNKPKNDRFYNPNFALADEIALFLSE